jgi:hypothetical protein
VIWESSCSNIFPRRMKRTSLPYVYKSRVNVGICLCVRALPATFLTLLMLKNASWRHCADAAVLFDVEQASEGYGCDAIVGKHDNQPRFCDDIIPDYDATTTTDANRPLPRTTQLCRHFRRRPMKGKLILGPN